MNELVISSSPFVHSKNDINKMFLYVAFMLILPAIYGIVLFGFNALLIISISVIVSVLSELIYNLFNSKRVFIDNLSYLVTGLILALSLPVKTPIYAVAIAAFVSVFIVKMAFGGLGRNPFNPALTGRCLAGLIVPGLSAELFAVTVFGEEYVSISAGGTNILLDLLIGRGSGAIGTTFIILILACFIVLSVLKVVDFRITLLSIIGYFIVGICLTNLESTMINMFSGSFIFVSVFMMTDPNTSPNNLLGKFIYSVGFGALSAYLWHLGTLGENTIFFVALLMNFIVPFMDKYFVLKPISIGGYRYARKN